MAELDNLLESVSETIKTYRENEMPTPDADHVNKWLQQFTKENHLLFLKEFDHLMKETFFTKENIETFLLHLTTNEKLSGKTPAAYWSNANILQIQKNGQSQREMLKLFDGCLQKSFGLTLKECGSENGDYIYLDDVLFSGGRIGTDLEEWITTKAPNVANIQIIVAALHTGGHYFLNRRLKGVIEACKKDIKLNYWRATELENQKNNRNNSNILWPVEIPVDKDVEKFMALPSRFPFEPRIPPQNIEHFSKPFSSEVGRQMLEQEFLKAGSKIIANIKELRNHHRPLGYSGFGVGFGATIATYRNCPNNCPLALWWGDPEVKSGALNWYPLLPRETYSSPRNVFQNLEDIEL